jgi:Zn-dependent oligopeptidase
MLEYTNLTPDDVEKGIDDAISQATEMLERIVDPGTEPTYATTVLAMDEVGDLMSQAGSRYGFMSYVHPDAEVRETALAGQEKLQAFGVEMIFREDLYEKVKEFSTTDEASALAGESARALEHGLRDFRRAGHGLEKSERDALKERAQRLSQIGIQFQSNIDNDPNRLLVDREDLTGLPDAYIESLETDEETGKLIITMAYPDVVPFNKHAERRDLREQLSFLYNTRAVEVNRPLLAEAIRLRDESAGILGYDSFAHYNLEERMAKTPENVASFYDDLIPGLTSLGSEELAEIRNLLEADTGDTVVRTWDWNFYDTAQRRTQYGVDHYEVAKYLPLARVLEGLFGICEEVFGLEITRLPDAMAWHPDVELYQISDSGSGEPLARFYLDLFPREGKFSHAAKFPIVPGRRLPDGSYQSPVCAMVANFTKPAADTPSLLQHSELETLFHEFGHVLHHSLGRTELAGFSGTSVERDFVEAPSQIMEHWVWRSDVLRRFAKHYETDEPIPDELVDQLVAARRLNKGIFQLRQTQFGILDAALHAPGADKDLDAILRDTHEISLMPYQEGTFFPASFGHLLGGYEASYYGYMWSEVYGDDMFSRFEEEGVTNPEVGRDYRANVLEVGGSLDAEVILRTFLGREPDNSAFLRKLGVAGTDPGSRSSNS